MVPFTPPLTDIRFVLDHLIGDDKIGFQLNFEEDQPELRDMILEETAKFATEQLEPLNQIGDTHGCVFENGVVRTPEGFKNAYQELSNSGWIGISADPIFGGQGLSEVLATATQEIRDAANMAFGVVPLLSRSAIELMVSHASQDQKATFLPKIVSGEWTTTMNLTEPQAGSDVGALNSVATKEGDHYRIKGQKIFISGGDHDYTENIMHLVLARTPDAPPGVKGISLFLVPKYLIKPDGELGERNDIRCVSIEKKLGINASPTCVMSFGENSGALGYLIGEENQGLACMFTMMNLARITVGVQGVGIAERAYQQALGYAKERLQGSKQNSNGKITTVSIIHHQDVKRMLMSMKATTEASRVLALYASHCLDVSKKHPNSETKRKFSNLVGLLTPLVKAWISDQAIEVANIGIQIHGGMGYIEETGASQYFRDARITAIYEGTNGIQANDLVLRKIVRDNGQTMQNLIKEMKSSLDITQQAKSTNLNLIKKSAMSAIESMERSTNWILETWPKQPDLVEAGATTFLRLSGNAIAGWLMAQLAIFAYALLENTDQEEHFLNSKIKSVRHFASSHLPSNVSLENILISGNTVVAEITEDYW